jgi:hypothetical protein
VFYHVAGTYDGNWMRLYLNGVEVGTAVETGPVHLVESNGVELSSNHETLHGLLDEVEIFNRALTADEIHAIYAAGSAGKWKPPTWAEKAIGDLVTCVAMLNVQEGILNSLDGKLDAALNALDDINENNDVAAINSLQAFINAVEAQRGKKISEEDADTLIAAALDIIAALLGE